MLTQKFGTSTHPRYVPESKGIQKPLTVQSICLKIRGSPLQRFGRKKILIFQGHVGDQLRPEFLSNTYVEGTGIKIRDNTPQCPCFNHNKKQRCFDLQPSTRTMMLVLHRFNYHHVKPYCASKYDSLSDDRFQNIHMTHAVSMYPIDPMSKITVTTCNVAQNPMHQGCPFYQRESHRFGART